MNAGFIFYKYYVISSMHLTEEPFITKQDEQWLMERTKEIFQSSNNISNALELCTGIFDFEHILLMGWYAHHKSKTTVKEAIQSLYPEFAAYLKDTKPTIFSAKTQWAINYLHEYKKAKILDTYTDEIKTFIKDKNSTPATFYKWYHSFRESHDVLAENSNNPASRPDTIYWIDGLGAEFFPYLMYLLEENGGNMKVIHSQIVRSTIPSSTSLNRYVGDKVRKFGALDELGHDAHGYKYLYTLNEELKVLNKIIKEIVNSCQKTKCTIAIVSDHGMSCLSRKVPSRKYEGKFEHEGRYINTTDNAQADHDYIVHKNENDKVYYKVALTHSSLAKVPTHEVHGGCTPEEVLVPFVLLSNKDIEPIPEYQITLMESEIMLSNPTIKVSIIPEPKEVTLTCEGHVYQMERSGTMWATQLQNITEGVHTVDIKPEKSVSVQREITVIGVGGSDIDDLLSF